MKNRTPVSIRLREFVFSLLEKHIKLDGRQVIFCFHSISEDDWLFSVTPVNFERFIKELLKIKEIVGLEDILNERRRESLNKVAITFDDGYEDVFKFAYPILKKYGLTACVFVNGVADTMGNSCYLGEKKLLGFKQLQKLKKEGWVIGYHTKSHSDLRLINEKSLVDEIITAKKRLEKKLGFGMIYFSYPYGVFNRKVVDIVQKAGYKYAFTVDGGGIDFDKLPFKIGRVLLDKYIKRNDLNILTSQKGLFFNKFLTTTIREKDNYFQTVRTGKIVFSNLLRNL